ncbi:ABC transporter ATP-binding protein [Geoalkalibacter halelectricus]|uniref:ABC transporter ATP-binding protein n=1 Tax=Geoalkalibacter halelectricus TaxID=2847045 RepID=A0ABY5ZPB5_9BACT|nr:ABC transporter ATP-binding protein [Geoalkalibacter halelectricus]MDO3379912.1 ABC transporter ATP-binding protein [Geoalkalibacter halelectricus]UWZ80561.1 ABC transporter ATP-binding protein [Geoalkalibacter halelectricus]
MSSSLAHVIRLEEVWKTYRVGSEDVHALAGVSVDFPQGSFWAVMGPSGSGKSTLLNLLGCLDRPTRGACFIQGQPTAGVDDDALSEIRLRHLGFIFQSFNLIAQLSVRENIELPLFYLGWDAERSRRRAEELAALVGLQERLEHRPNELSGGQQQRVAIARALANDPQIILADEPTGNLDTATGTQIMEMLQSLNAQGKTVIMVTHEPEIAAYADHRLHIRDGLIDRIESKSQ